MTYYDQIAQGYNELHFDEQKKKAGIILKELKIKQTDKLLDVGCGTGKITELFPCKVIGIDPSKELLKQVKIPVVHGAAENLPFADKSFDIVISLTAIHNFDDVGKALKEMLRVAKREMVISVLKKARNFAEIEQKIKQILAVNKIVEEQHDMIMFCSA